MASSTLAKLLNNKEVSPLLVIEDSVQQSAYPLLREWVLTKSSTAGRAARQELVVCCVEHPPKIVREKILGQDVEKAFPSATYIDVGSSWLWGTQVPAQDAITTSFEKLGDVLHEQLRADVKTTVVFEGVTEILSHQTLSAFARFMKRIAAMANETHTFIFPFHSDAALSSSTSPTSPTLTTLLSQVSTTFLTIRPGKDFGVTFADTPGPEPDVFKPVDAHSHAGVLCEVLHKKKSGKILREVVGVRFVGVDGRDGPAGRTVRGDHARWKVMTIEELGGWSATTAPARLDQAAAKQADEPDPTANLSFNLRLTDEQRSARSEVVLPYLHAQQLDSPLTSHQTSNSSAAAPPSSTGMIYYDDDDYDSDDPDADLDI
ncbi:Elongator complex protein 5 [Fimicolochytrium jonesii]|uniref:Elongator complex protein 5 n=1 Tax=Fimicolochytrium jonesii TaxID=1396493 RepID=UPI0022FE7CA0|nr:Elongator complex protein 5 [Fimicolochytrium jonesii]KAI8816393.1 Elongator complex protein 5 [Fimicolochytrium jonesii]